MIAPPSTAIARLELSRERMRAALHDAAADRTAGAGPCGAAQGAWLDTIRAIPGVAGMVDAACEWWHRHPLHSVGTAVVAVAKSALQPVASRHPLGLVLGAVVLGAVLVWVRPWHALIRPALWAGLLPSILAGAAARAPLQSWLAALVAAGHPADPAAAAP